MSETTTSVDRADDTINVFIAYRQGEGDQWAAELYALLQGTTIELAAGRRVRLHVYWDKAAPTIDDFRKLWKGHLRTARAFILVCTPGTSARRSAREDWLFDEIEWWKKHRKVGPILVDPLTSGEGAVPGCLLAKWPHAQRATWADDITLGTRILEGIALSERGVQFEELRRLWRLRFFLVSLLILAVGLAVLGYLANREAVSRTVRDESNRLVAASERAQVSNPTLAYRIAEAALDRDPTNRDAYRKLLETYYLTDAFSVILARHSNAPFGTSRPIYAASEVRGGNSLVVADLYSPDALQFLTLDGRRLKSVSLAERADFVMVSPQGDRILTTFYPSNRVNLLDMEGHQVRAFEFPENAEIARFSPDGKSILVGAGDLAYLWVTTENQPSRVLRGHTSSVNDVAFSVSGRYLLTAGDDTARLWDRHGRLLKVLRHPDDVTSVAMFGENEDARIATTCFDKLVRVWRPDGTLARTHAGHESRVYSAAFSPDGKFLATASWDNTIRIWDAVSLNMDAVKVLKGHSSGVGSVSFLSRGDLVLTASSDATLRLWDIATPKTVKRPLSMRDNDTFQTLPSDPYALRGTYRGIEMLTPDQQILFTLPIEFEDRIFQGMYSDDQAYVLVQRYAQKFPVGAGEIRRLMDVERRFGTLPGRAELEANGAEP